MLRPGHILALGLPLLMLFATNQSSNAPLPPDVSFGSSTDSSPKVAQGTTTNESFKWRHLLKCHAHMLKQREWATTAVPKSKARAAAAEKAAAGAEAAGAADAAELREKAALLRTEHEELAAEAQMLLELSPADMAPPNNKYNRGFGVNLMEVLFPLCDRAAATADGKKQIAVWPLAKGGEEEPAGEEPAGTEEEPKKDK